MNDNYSIRFNPRTEGPYKEDDAKKAKPTGSTHSARNFKNVLDKDEDKENTSKVAKKPETSDEDEFTTSGVSEEEEVAKKRQSFSLFAQRKPKVGLSKEAPQPDPELIAEADEQPLEKTEEFVDVEQSLAGLKEDKSKITDPFLQAARELPKKMERAAPEVVAGQQSVVAPPSQKKEETSLYAPRSTSRSNKEGQVDSPATLFAKQNKGDTQDATDGESSTKTSLSGFDQASLAAESDASISVKKKENVANPFAQEQIDLTKANPQGVIQPLAAMEVVGNLSQVAKPIAPSATLQALLEQLVKEITVMTRGDKTETTLILSQPPLFAGAQLVITGFASAKGEMNITFANLTQNAQMVVQQQQHNLLAGLEAKGYHVHIFTATTVAQQPIASADTSQANKERQRGEGEETPEERRRRQNG